MDYKDIRLENLDVIQGKPYHNHHALEFWTPSMYVPFGLDHFQNKWGEKYDIKLSFRNEQGQFLNKFMNKIKVMDAYFKRVHNGTEYISMLKNGQNLVVKLPYVNEKFLCGVKSNFEPLPTVFSIKKGCWVKCLIKADKVWEHQKRSGCLLVAKEIIIVHSGQTD